MSLGKKGFRQKPQANRKERLNELEQRIGQLEMASRISQMMTQQLMNNMKHMQQDLGRALGLLNETQYKILAIQEVSGLDLAAMNAVANTKRLTDFNEASAREDAEGNFTVGDVVAGNSTIILTSTTKDVDAGIFRSRIKLADCGVPELIKAFTGAVVGAKATVALNGVDHEIELLGIRNPAPVTVSGQDASLGESTDAEAATEPLQLAPASNQAEGAQALN
jgi:hypothetical protein